MVSINDFHELVGRTVMLCQMIEINVQLMYAGMLEGSFKRNLAMVKHKPLGTVLVSLREMDNADGRPYFSASDYDLLFEIKDIRNFWVHGGYAPFIYLPEDKWQAGLEEQYFKLRDVVKRLSGFSKETESVRLDVMRKFGRI